MTRGKEYSASCYGGAWVIAWVGGNQLGIWIWEKESCEGVSWSWEKQEEQKLRSRDFWVGFFERNESLWMSKSGLRRYSRYVHCELWIFSFWILFCLMSLLIYASFIHLCCWFFLCFLNLAWKTSEALYHVHYEASRDIGCIFVLNVFVIFPPIWAHWTIMKCGFHWFIFFSFLHALFSWLFSSIFYGYFGCMALCTTNWLW